jgi:hypothetical protein
MKQEKMPGIKHEKPSKEDKTIYLLSSSEDEMEVIKTEENLA